jgi:hypothetical protein
VRPFDSVSYVIFRPRFLIKIKLYCKRFFQWSFLLFDIYGGMLCLPISSSIEHLTRLEANFWLGNSNIGYHACYSCLCLLSWAPPNACSAHFSSCNELGWIGREACEKMWILWRFDAVKALQGQTADWITEEVEYDWNSRFS